MAVEQPITFGEYIRRVNHAYALHMGGWRYGQTLFNTLRDERPDIAESIRGGPCDPFYAQRTDDLRIATFLNEVSAQW